MNMKKDKLFVLATLGLAAVMFAFAPVMQDHKPWPVPDAAAKVKNPLKSDSENLNLGKSLYAKNCRSCHGKSGEGDGTKAAELETFPGDFTTKEFQAETDGAIFYKTQEGRDDMPSFKKKIANDEDIWAIIIYLRTLKAG
jgi:mono/diheme cytochrome c family protein